MLDLVFHNKNGTFASIFTGYKNVEYNEWVPAGTLVKSLFSFVILIIIVVTFAILIFNKEFLIEDILGITFVWLVMAILALVLWNYRGLQIKINATHLSVNYGRFDKKSFFLKDITSCKTTKAELIVLRNVLNSKFSSIKKSLKSSLLISLYFLRSDLDII